MTVENTALLVITFLYGIIIGSFLNVCIYRLPKKESVVTVGSHCMKCNHSLQWYDLVPLFSWIFLKGKCRYCGEKINKQYPIVEFLNGALYVLVFCVNGWNVESVLWCLVTSALLVNSVIDINIGKIRIEPDILIFVIGVIHIFMDRENWLMYLIGFFLASLFLLLCSIIFRFITGKVGIGLGDIELVACTGLCIGAAKSFFGMTLGCVLACVIQIPIVIVKSRKLKRENKEEKKVLKVKFSFGPYLAAGAFIAMLWGDLIYNWYLSLTSIYL